MSVGGNTQTYSFDTSALIDGIERFYPISNFPGLWQRIDGLISEGRLRVSEEAWSESLAGIRLCGIGAQNVESIAHGVSIRRTRLWHPWQARSRKSFRGGRDKAERTMQDPFVIAVAEINNCMVISGETNGGPGRPKIPYVCRERNVRHGRFVDVVIAEGWVFG